MPRPVSLMITFHHLQVKSLAHGSNQVARRMNRLLGIHLPDMPGHTLAPGQALGSCWRLDMCNAEMHHLICGQLSAHHGGHLASYLLELIKVHIPATPQGQQQASAAGLKPSMCLCSSV